LGVSKSGFCLMPTITAKQGTVCNSLFGGQFGISTSGVCLVPTSTSKEGQVCTSLLGGQLGTTKGGFCLVPTSTSKEGATCTSLFGGQMGVTRSGLCLVPTSGVGEGQTCKTLLGGQLGISNGSLCLVPTSTSKEGQVCTSIFGGQMGVTKGGLCLVPTSVAGEGNPCYLPNGTKGVTKNNLCMPLTPTSTAENRHCCCSVSAGAVGNASVNGCSWQPNSVSCGSVGLNTSSAAMCAGIATTTPVIGNPCSTEGAGQCVNRTWSHCEKKDNSLRWVIYDTNVNCPVDGTVVPTKGAENGSCTCTTVGSVNIWKATAPGISCSLQDRQCTKPGLTTAVQCAKSGSSCLSANCCDGSYCASDRTCKTSSTTGSGNCTCTVVGSVKIWKGDSCSLLDRQCTTAGQTTTVQCAKAGSSCLSANCCSGNFCNSARVCAASVTTAPTKAPGGGGGGTGGSTTAPTSATNKCTECPKTFSCYSNNGEYKWFATGMPMIGFTLESVETNCTAVAPKPTFLGKSKGDANCDGTIDTADYSLWHKDVEC
jgi:hypothetical protein